MEPQEIIDLYNKYQAYAMPHRKKAELHRYADLIENFSVWLRNQHASHHYLKTYFEKIFSYFLQQDKLNAINPKVIFAKSMRQRYANVIIQYDFKNHELVSLEDKKQIYSLSSQDLSAIYKAEEAQKQRYFGSRVGLLTCTENTTMYHHASDLCRACKFASECQEIQAGLYPNLKRNRTK